MTASARGWRRGKKKIDADVFEKKEEKNETTSVYRLGLSGRPAGTNRPDIQMKCHHYVVKIYNSCHLVIINLRFIGRKLNKL